QWFNTAAFAVAPPFTIGSSSRNPVRGPSYRNVDVALMRRVSVGRGVVEARAEIFNLLNTPALGAPAAVIGAANFGTTTTAGDPGLFLGSGFAVPGWGFWGSGLLRFWVRVLRRPVLDTRERFTPRARQRVTALSRCEARTRRATAAGVGSTPR